MNKLWPKWITASIAKYFNDNRGSYPMYVEGAHRNEIRDPIHFELRIDGPYLTPVSKGCWEVYIEVSLMVQATMDDTHLYAYQELTGYLASLCTNISIFKYGVYSDDHESDGSLVGCLNVVSDSRGKERIQINNFGQVRKDVKLLQGSVEVHYKALWND